MTKHEISSIERDIADIAVRICDAEKSIRQLQHLKECCTDYLSAFEDFQYTRKQRVKELLHVEGQDKLIGDYADVMDGILMGDEYRYAYVEADAAVSDIEDEIKKQELIISECRQQQSALHQNITCWKRELINVKEE